MHACKRSVDPSLVSPEVVGTEGLEGGRRDVAAGQTRLGGDLPAPVLHKPQQHPQHPLRIGGRWVGSRGLCTYIHDARDTDAGVPPQHATQDVACTCTHGIGYIPGKYACTGTPQPSNNSWVILHRLCRTERLQPTTERDCNLQRSSMIQYDESFGSFSSPACGCMHCPHKKNTPLPTPDDARNRCCAEKTGRCKPG